MTKNHRLPIETPSKSIFSFHVNANLYKATKCCLLAFMCKISSNEQYDTEYTGLTLNHATVPLKEFMGDL